MAGYRGMRRNRALIDALAADADRQLAAVEQRHSAVTARASTLVAAAGLAGGILGTSTATIFSSIAVVTSLAAAGVAVSVLFLRFRAAEIDLEAALDRYWNDEPATAIRNFTVYRMSVVRDDERALRRRAAMLHVGFAVFVLALAATAAHVLCSMTSLEGT